ncbi:DUF5617 domain-containing protein [Legionella erythra]|uniref:RavJ-like C-terminal domain-containing protein n=1 Tax=Legionella erythra TaxID=448 RepID=A0A0W0TT08_LEGER|nr:DUF5617 domain-containing protein [Legionella erythra]KTC98883.1 hypothetical protein Lery_0686 [Legionella erythra]
MPFQLTYFKTIDLSGTSFAEKIKNTLSLLVDPVEIDEIPEKPVIVRYVRSNAFRVMSAVVLQEMLDYKQSRLSYISLHSNDKSKIALALKKSEAFTTLEHHYKSFLESLIAAQYSYGEILTLCKSFEEKWDFYYSIDPQLKDKELLQHTRLAISPKNRPAFDHFATCFTPALMSTDFIALSSFVEGLASQQQSTYEKYKGDEKSFAGLQNDEVYCPSTRLVIDARESLTTQNNARNFIDIYMVLAMMAKVEAPEINVFLESKPADYMQKCEQKLYCYLHNSWLLGFTKTETQLLSDMGGAKIKKALPRDHSHLWQLECTPKQNTLKILIDYSKLDSAFPRVSLFFTAHRGRHHHEAVKKAVEGLVQGEKMKTVLNTLETEAREHPQFNEEGSLMCRLRFIDMHVGPRPAIETVSAKTPPEEVVISPK